MAGRPSFSKLADLQSGMESLVAQNQALQAQVAALLAAQQTPVPVVPVQAAIRTAPVQTPVTFPTTSTLVAEQEKLKKLQAAGPEAFVLQFLRQNRELNKGQTYTDRNGVERPKGAGTHVRYGNLNNIVRKLWPNTDPVVLLNKMALQGSIVVIPCRGGAMALLAEDATPRPTKQDGSLGGILRNLRLI